MSRSGNKPRNSRDFYETPGAVVRPVIREIAEAFEPMFPGYPPLDPGRSVWLDPGAGLGAITREIRRLRPDDDITAVELGDEATLQALKPGEMLNVIGLVSTLTAEGASRVILRDVREVSAADFDRSPNVVVCNPPFTFFEMFRDHALDLMRPHLEEGDPWAVAMLLNVHAFGTLSRLPGWRERPPDYLRWIVPRPSFDGVGTDPTEYAWVLWTGGIEFLGSQAIDFYNQREHGLDAPYIHELSTNVDSVPNANEAGGAGA